MTVSPACLIKITYAVQAMALLSAALAVTNFWRGLGAGDHGIAAVAAVIVLANAGLFAALAQTRRRLRGVREALGKCQHGELHALGKCSHCGADDWAVLHTTWETAAVCRQCWRRV